MGFWKFLEGRVRGFVEGLGVGVREREGSIRS